MVTEVTMPQMGETVTEGTITAWLKQPGDQVAVDEPLLEISTDKVDSEIPSPWAGTLEAILVPDGETVPIGTPIARIVTNGDAPAEAPEAAPAEVAAEAPPEPVLAPDPAARATGSGARTPKSESAGFLSPVVSRLLAEHGLDPKGIEGSGAEGRITRDDVLAAVGRAEAPVPTPEGAQRVPFTAIRKVIGANLMRSLATAAHTLVVTEVDYAGVAPVREEAGLTWLPFIARAAIDALTDFPFLNAHVRDEGLDVFDGVHLGVAVDLDFQGLVVPVVRDAQRLRLRALADQLAERAAAARAGTLGPDDLSGGTLTITNAGRYGTLFTAPIINQPQAAILSTDGVKVRPVAVPVDGGASHGLAFHPVGNLALSFDHRAFDGAYAAAYLARVRETLEGRPWTEELA